MVQQYLAKIAWDQVGQKAFESVASNAVGSIMGLFGSKSNAAANARAAAKLQYENNLKLQKQAQQWNEYMYKNRYSMQVEDLENAGINKLFGMGQAPTVTSGMNSVGMADMVGEQNNKVQQFLQALDLGQNLSAKRAQTKLLENQAKTEEINTNLKTIEVEEKNILNAMNRIKLKFLPQREKAEIENQITQSKNNISSAQKNISDINTASLNNKQTERINKFYEEHPKIGKFITGLGQTREAIFAGLAIGGGGAAIANKNKPKSNTARRKARNR